MEERFGWCQETQERKQCSVETIYIRLIQLRDDFGNLNFEIMTILGFVPSDVIMQQLYLVKLSDMKRYQRQLTKIQH